MGIYTSTGTLTAGQSRTFNLSPASAVTLTLSPNVRVTITETPATVAATGLGGNASRVHEPRLPGVVTYGPYPMGGSVLVEVESNSGSSVGWVRSDSIVAESADGAQFLVDGAGNKARVTAPPSYMSMSQPWVADTADGVAGGYADFATDGTGSVSAQQAEYAKLGTSGVKMIWSAGGTYCRVGKLLSSIVAIPDGSVGLFIKWPGDQGLGFTLYISNDFGWTNAASYFFTGNASISNGWTLVLIAQSDFSLGGTFAWATGMKQWRIALSGASASYPEVGFGGMVLGVKSKPIIFLSCDDGWNEQRDVALPILRKYGYTATMYLNGTNAGSANYMTTAQLQEMQNVHGWDMANHGFGHLHYPTLTEAQMIADYNNNVTWLNSLGANSAHHFCYPYGEAAAGVGGAIPAQVVAAQGAITGRLATSAFYRGFQSYPDTGLVDPMHIRAVSMGKGAVSNTVAVLKANIDLAITRGENIAPYFHKVIDQQNPTGTGGTLPADGNDYYKDDFEAVIAYCRAKEDAGQCIVVGSVRELYALTQS